MNHEFDLRDLLALYKKHKLLRPAMLTSYADAVINLERFNSAGVRLDVELQ